MLASLQGHWYLNPEPASPAMLGLLQALPRSLPWHPWPPERALVPALGCQPSCQQVGALWPSQHTLAGH